MQLKPVRQSSVCLYQFIFFSFKPSYLSMRNTQKSHILEWNRIQSPAILPNFKDHFNCIQCVHQLRKYNFNHTHCPTKYKYNSSHAQCVKCLKKTVCWKFILNLKNSDKLNSLKTWATKNNTIWPNKLIKSEHF